MNRDAFAFFNDQLAAMLRQGIPLEGALRQLASGMERGQLRDECQKLEADLARGRPLREALADRKVPEIYRRLLIAGAEGGDLPGLLTLAADHYHHTANLSTRLRGLMVYPLLALIVSLLVSLLLLLVLGSTATGTGLLGELTTVLPGHGPQPNISTTLHIGALLPPIVLGLGLLGTLLILGVPSLRHRLRWTLPGFRDASLAQLASSLSLLLQAGCRLPEALRLCAGLEPHPPAAREIQRWDDRLAQGESPAPADPRAHPIFPPLFLWLITSDAGNWTAGLARAAEIYRRRAQGRTEMLLYAALPVMVLFLGFIVLGQAAYAVQLIYTTFASTLEMFG